MSEQQKRPTLEELEQILASGKPLPIQIQPDGSILAVEQHHIPPALLEALKDAMIKATQAGQFILADKDFFNAWNAVLAANRKEP